jgi:hypothetical protein
MQKLVTIYLDNSAYSAGKGLLSTYAGDHGLVEEHLRRDLKDGWVIKAIHGFGGNSEGITVRGWVIALLEKSPAEPPALAAREPGAGRLE